MLSYTYFLFTKDKRMKPRKFEIIACPFCGYEYLPAEIYVSRAFFGKPENIERNAEGAIVSYTNSSVDVLETYTCDKCNHNFKITAKMVFVTEEDKLENFDEEYSTKLQKNVLFLEED